jgi:ABC-type bacteriocin/lantibiotic exporter with double-glycine peptidase domain
MIWRRYYGHYKKLARIVGKKGCALFIFSVAASIALSVIEYGVALFLMVFLFTLGFIDYSQLPKWLPVDMRTVPPMMIWIFLFVLTALRGGLQIFAYMSKTILSQRTHLRLRMLLGYLMMGRDSSHCMPLSEVNLFFSEFFPKTAGFLFHLTQLISLCVQALMLCLSMFYFARNETWVSLIGFCAMGVLVMRLNRMTNRQGRKVPAAGAALERTKVRIIRNWLLIKILRTENEEYKTYTDAVGQYYRHSTLANLIANSGGSLIPILGVIVIAVVVLINLQFFRTPGANLVAFLYLFVRFQHMAANTSLLIGDLFTCRVQLRESINLIAGMSETEIIDAFRPAGTFGILKGKMNYAYLDREKIDSTADTYLAPPSGPPAVQLRRVTYTWPRSHTPLLRDLDLTIAPGSQLGIIGPNGSGKSTLLGIICGILSPDSGTVTIDGLAAEEYLQRFPFAVAYVGPDPYLIHGSIRDNLAYGSKTAPDDASMMAALTKVCLDDFVSALPGGLDYTLEESHAGLSTGQKQRLTIARAFLRNPWLLILDEPTANVDTATEGYLIAALSDLKRRSTVIVVSHKPSILKLADAILNMHNPQVSEVTPPIVGENTHDPRN